MTYLHWVKIYNFFCGPRKNLLPSNISQQQEKVKYFVACKTMLETIYSIVEITKSWAIHTQLLWSFLSLLIVPFKSEK